MSTPTERMAARFGNRILAAGEHTINVAGFISRDDTTTITGATIKGVELDADGLEDAGYFPEGTVFYKTELFMFPEGEEPTAITVGGATGSISVIVGG